MRRLWRSFACELRHRERWVVDRSRPSWDGGRTVLHDCRCEACGRTWRYLERRRKQPDAKPGEWRKV